MTPYWELTVRDSFSAAHALRGYQGKCENLHGHNFKVEISVRGIKLQPATEFLIDFGILKKALANVLRHLDHLELNTTEPFDQLNPTSENLARYIFSQMQLELEKADFPADLGLQLTRATVSENERQSASWIAIE